MQYRDGSVTYFNGQLPVFTHPSDDVASFRMFTSQLVINGTVTQGQIARAFAVPRVTVKRYVKKYRQSGAAPFFQPPKPRQGRKLTPQVVLEAQRLLDEGLTVPKVSEQLGVLANTVHKAIRAGRLQRPSKKKAPT